MITLSGLHCIKFQFFFSSKVSLVSLLGTLLSALRPPGRQRLHPRPRARHLADLPTLELILPAGRGPLADGLRHQLLPPALPRVPRPRLRRDPLE